MTTIDEQSETIPLFEKRPRIGAVPPAAHEAMLRNDIDPNDEDLDEDLIDDDILDDDDDDDVVIDIHDDDDPPPHHRCKHVRENDSDIVEDLHNQIRSNSLKLYNLCCVIFLGVDTCVIYE